MIRILLRRYVCVAVCLISAFGIYFIICVAVCLIIAFGIYFIFHVFSHVKF